MFDDHGICRSADLHSIIEEIREVAQYQKDDLMHRLKTVAYTLEGLQGAWLADEQHIIVLEGDLKRAKAEIAETVDEKAKRVFEELKRLIGVGEGENNGKTDGPSKEVETV